MKRTFNLLFVVFALALSAASCFVPATAQAQALGDYFENQAVDVLLRAQTTSLGANVYVGLSTAACSDSSVGTEVSGGSYARVAVARSLAAWAGTQSAASTTASTGTGGVTSNNAVITFPSPSAGWGTVTHFFVADAASGSNIIVCQALTTSKTINSGDTVTFPAGTLTITFQ